MARRPRHDRDGIPPAQGAKGVAVPAQADEAPRQLPSAAADEAVLRLARLLGRQIAREQFDGARPLPRRKSDAP